MGKSFSIKRQSGFAMIACCCFFLLYMPIANLVVYAFNAGTLIAIWEGFSFRWFESAWNNQQVIEAFWRSLQIAAIAAVIATACATLAAIATTRTAPYPGLTFKYSIINMPLLVPDIFDNMFGGAFAATQLRIHVRSFVFDENRTLLKSNHQI